MVNNSFSSWIPIPLVQQASRLTTQPLILRQEFKARCSGSPQLSQWTIVRTGTVKTMRRKWITALQTQHFHHFKYDSRLRNWYLWHWPSSCWVPSGAAGEKTRRICPKWVQSNPAYDFCKTKIKRRWISSILHYESCCESGSSNNLFKKRGYGFELILFYS